MTFKASISTTSISPPFSGRNFSMVCGSCRASGGSISTATMSFAASRMPRVSEPRPGPTSSTVSSGEISAALTIRRIVLGSITKFCPRVFVGRIPSISASSRISAGPSRGRSFTAFLHIGGWWGGYSLDYREKRCFTSSRVASRAFLAFVIRFFGANAIRTRSRGPVPCWRLFTLSR